jgi:hypothetical protein
MKISIDIPKYNKNKGFEFNWVNDFNIEIKYSKGIIQIKANKEGLLSLANHLINLSQDDVPEGYHIHLDELNSLEDGSNEVIIAKHS